MKNLKDIVLEKLKVSKSNIINITFENLVDAICKYASLENIKRDMGEPTFMLTDMTDEKDLPEFEYYTNPRSNGIAKLYGLDITYNKEKIFIYFRYENKEYIKGQYDNRNVKSLDELYKFVDEYIVEDIYDFIQDKIKK